MLSTAPYTSADLSAAVEAAVRAPSVYNSQPWRFRLADGAIELWLDDARGPHGPGEPWGALVSCGAALLNLRLALAAAGTPPVVTVQPEAGEPLLLARLIPGERRMIPPGEAALHAAIPRRCSNRQPFLDTAVPPGPLHRLVAAAQRECGWLEVLIGSYAVAAVAEIARGADRVLNRDPAYAAEVGRWTRGTPAPDGVSPAESGPAGEPQDLLPQRPFARRPRTAGRDFEAEPVVAVLGNAGDTLGDRVQAGQALQRVLLTATDAGLSVSLLSQPIEVPVARDQLRRALGRSDAPHMVLRIGYGVPAFPSDRRPVGDVVD